MPHPTCPAFALRCLQLGMATWALCAALSGCSRPADLQAGDILASYRASTEYRGITITNPLDETLFPPEIAPPTFNWTDSEDACDTWAVAIQFADADDRISALTKDSRWTPNVAQWNEIKRHSRATPATVVILGVQRDTPRKILSGARITIRTSTDDVGAPLFYREVNLPFIEAVKDPSKIRWRMGPISSLVPPPVVLTNLPVCGNCHSFSADGAVLGMDVDYANDKGSYTLTAVRQQIDLTPADIITWSNFRRDDGEPTFGLLSQVSPDGRYVVSTVKDRSVFVATPDLAFSQLFFPIRGILVVYDRQTETFTALPGADDPRYVQSNPTWSPDGKHIVFARSEAYHLAQDRGNALLTREECSEFLEHNKAFRFDLYRLPFNNGAGGTAQPLPGASHNGKSNFFARYSPDGQWIVFCQSANYMLLQPDSALYIIPAAGGEARRLRCNTDRMNSWHSWSPNSKWLVFSSKANSDYTQLYLTHIDEQGFSTPPVLLSRMTVPDRAANIPEFVNADAGAIAQIRPAFLDDVSYVRAGESFMRAGHDVAGALRQYRKALKLNPDNAIAHSNLGGLLVTQGQIAEGVKHLQTAIRLDPTNGSPYYNLGMLRLREGDTSAAIELLTQAVQYRTDLADAHRVLGSLLCEQGRLDAGTQHLTESIRLEPRNAVGHREFARALAAQGRSDEAITHLQRAVELDPGDIAACGLLVQVLFLANRQEDAAKQLWHAVRLEPDNPRWHEDLAWILLMSPDPALHDPGAAAMLAQRACELTNHQAFKPLDLLGVAHAAMGRYHEALTAAEAALQLARAAGQNEIATRIAERIALYRNGQPYVPPKSSE